MTRRIITTLGLGLLAIGISLIGYQKIKRSILIDACLDSGGRWNHETKRCEFAKSSSISPTFDTTKQIERKENSQAEVVQPLAHGYNELADEDEKEIYEISDYNTDNPDIVNINRPKRTLISNPIIDTTSLFRIWTKYTDAPHATFVISSKAFYVVDYDGDGSMPYILNRDSLTIYYNDFIQKGRIINVTKDTLTIKWSDTKSSTHYLEWKN